MSVVVVATFRPRPEDFASVREGFLEAVPLVHQEEGCELYALHDMRDALVFVEQWSSRDHLKAHMRSDATRRLMSVIDGRLAESPVILTGDAAAAGTDHQGRIVPDGGRSRGRGHS